MGEAEGLMTVLVQSVSDEWEERMFSEQYACLDCGISFDKLEARHFSFNSPYGACPTCHGLGTQMIFDEDLVVPDTTSHGDRVDAYTRGAMADGA